MEVVIVRDPDELGRLVGGAIAALVEQKPAAVLGLATGSSPLPVYADLIRRYREGTLTLASCQAFLLDEYVGLDARHPQRYRSVIDRELVSHVDLDADAVASPDGTATDLLSAAARYEAGIARAGGIDLQLLGIGADGHIGFNEPVSSLGSRTRVKTLTDETRRDNARFFDSIDLVPRHVLTQGIGTILEAQHLVLVATGATKAEPVRQAVEGPLTARCPASALQLHPHATVVVDEPAAAALELAPYYRATWAAKPAWQGL